MNGKKSKHLRRQVYGDHSIRGRYYTQSRKGVVRCTGLRARYQQIKHTITRRKVD